MLVVTNALSAKIIKIGLFREYLLTIIYEISYYRSDLISNNFI
jgi:hypothetical protein